MSRRCWSDAERPSHQEATNASRNTLRTPGCSYPCFSRRHSDAKNCFDGIATCVLFSYTYTFRCEASVRSWNRLITRDPHFHPCGCVVPTNCSQTHVTSTFAQVLAKDAVIVTLLDSSCSFCLLHQRRNFTRDNIEGTLLASMRSQSKRMTDIPRPVLRDIDHHPETFYVGLHPRSANLSSDGGVGDHKENSLRHAVFYS